MGACPLELIGACKSYPLRGRELPVLQDVHLQVRSQQVLAVLGPSGCGKSTLLRVLAGLEPLTAGQRRVQGPGGGRLRIGMVFQEPLLFPWLTVRENVALGLGYRANRGVAGQKEVAAVLEELGLAEVADRYPSELSGGQAQRASLARAWLTRPQVLLLDEPFSSLDPPTRAALQGWLVERKRRDGLAVVLVTHDVEEALRVADRIVLLSARPARPLREWELPPAGTPDGAARQQLACEILAHYQPFSALAPSSRR